MLSENPTRVPVNRGKQVRTCASSPRQLPLGYGRACFETISSRSEMGVRRIFPCWLKRVTFQGILSHSIDDLTRVEARTFDRQPPLGGIGHHE
jgi:hypothetical protein